MRQSDWRNELWHQIRAYRALRPGLTATDTDRRAEYLAGLAQFEEYMVAAEAVTPTTRPLQLYYALGQAGMAIAAARLHRTYRRRHGLTLAPPETDVTETAVRAAEDGLFQAVCDATGSHRLTGQTALGALWASLPEIAAYADEERWPTAARVWLREDDPYYMTTLSGLQVVVRLEPWPQDPDEVEERLRRYPGAEALSPVRVAGVPGVVAMTMPHGAGVPVALPVDPEGRPLVVRMDEIAPAYRVAGERWLRPAFGAREDVLSPLMTWWALLFGLSVLSRYHPVTWATALAIEESPLAADLERVLQAALEAVPRLIVSALGDVDVLYDE